MNIFLAPNHNRNRKKLWYLFFVVVIATVAAVAYIFLRGKEEITPNFVLTSQAETHIPIQEWTTPHGMKVLLVSTKELPMIDLRLIFTAGSAYDGALSGLSELTSQLLLEGTAQFDAHTIASRIDNTGAQLATAVNRDMMSIAFRSMSEETAFEEAFSTLLSVLAEPTFPEEAFVREQKRLLSALEEQKQLPSVIAANHFFATLYDNHPYAQPVLGTTETVAQITRDDVVAFAQRYYNTQNAVLAIVGDIDLTAVHGLIDRIETALPTDIPPAEPLPEPVLSEKSVLNVPFHSTQTHIFYGTLGIDWKDPDFFPLYVGNQMLGASSLVSILFEEVREVRGLAYSINSQLNPLLQKGPFVVVAQTRNEASEEAVAVIQEVVQEFITNGPTPEQLTAIQSKITGGFALRLDSNAALVDELGMMGFYNLPSDYLASYRAHILDVNAEQIRTAFQNRINLDKSVLITVGGR